MKKAITIILSIMLVMAITLPAAALSSVAVKSIKLDKNKITMKVGETYNLKVTFTPAQTTQKLLSYVTDNKKIATVDKNGKITAIGAGNTVITVISSSNKNISAKCKVTVSKSTVNLNSQKEKKIKAEPHKIKFLCAGFDGKDPENKFTKAIKRFEKETGKEVEIIQVAGSQLWNDKVAANIASGDPIDVFNIYIPYYVSFYHNNYIEPLNDYIDLNNKNYDKAAMDKFVNFNNKYYVACGQPSAYVMYYNEGILTSNGFDADEPVKLYKQGKWNWETFKNIARKCHDPNNTGIVGFENMFNDSWLSANDCSAVKLDKDSKYVLNIKDPAVKECLELVQDIFFKNKVAGEGYVNGQNNFINGKAALHAAYCYDENTFAKAKEKGVLNFNYGVAPFPLGPSNKTNATPVWSDGFAISIGSKAPYTSGKLIDTIYNVIGETSADTDKNLLPGSAKLYQSLTKNPAQTNYTDGVLQNGFGSFYLFWDVQNGNDINKKIDEFTTVYQQMVDEANKKIK